MEAPTKEEVKTCEIIRSKIADLNWNEADLADKNLVRFVRARNNNLDAIELMIRKNHDWFLAEDVKGLLQEFGPPKGWEDEDGYFFKMTGFDTEGCPVLVAPFGRWDFVKEICNGNKETFKKYIYYNMEKLMTLVKRISKKDDHIKQIVGIVDLEGLSFRQVASIEVVETLIHVLQQFEANYPETVKSAVIINAPWPFQILWKLVKPFLSERTHSKLNFVGANKEKWREAILAHMNEDQFPEYYGGTQDNSKRYFIRRNGTLTCSENQNEGDDADSLDIEDLGIDRHESVESAESR